MVEYRAYFLAYDGHFQKVRVLSYPDDSAAIAEAKKLLDGHDIEVWQLERMVARLEHDKK